MIIMQKLIEGGVLEVLSELTTHDNYAIQLNALWALMVCSRCLITSSINHTCHFVHFNAHRRVLPTRLTPRAETN